MSQLNFLPIQTEFGILASRTDFWLNQFNFHSNGNKLNIDIIYSQLNKNKDGKTFKKSEFISIIFTNVSNFKMYQYDEFEHLYSKKSNSNFDFINFDDNGVNIYLLWTYDHCFEIYAKGYSFLPFDKKDNSLN